MVLIKKKYQRVVIKFLTGSCQDTPGFFFLCFFFNPARFQPQVDWVPDQPAGPGWIFKLWLHPISLIIF